MVEITVDYLGELRCKATHGPSGATLLTDAPTDNQGMGQSFSPTDLVATAMGTCALTIMGIAARGRGIDLSGATVRVQKEMVAQPTRRIGRLTVEFTIPAELTDEQKGVLKRAALTCPVHKSVLPEIEIPITFKWGKAQQVEKL